LGVRVVPLLQGELPGTEEGLRALPRSDVLLVETEQATVPVSPFDDMATSVPEPPERRAQAKTVRDVTGRDAPGESSPQVVLLGFQAVQPMGLVGSFLVASRLFG
jgi:hypothetical protein